MYAKRSRRNPQRGEVRGESSKVGGSYAAARAWGLGVARVITLAFVQSPRQFDAPLRMRKIVQKRGKLRE